MPLSTDRSRTPQATQAVPDRGWRSPWRWWREEVGNPATSLMAAVIGGSIGLSLAADAKTDSTGHWFALFGGAVVGVWVPPMSSGLVKLLNELGRVAIHTVRVRSLGVGTALTVGGIGLFVAKLPETVAYAVRYIPMTPSEYPWENDYALPTALHRDEMLIGLAAMLIASGLFLRTLPKADDF